jgi:hypothetical protein
MPFLRFISAGLNEGVSESGKPDRAAAPEAGKALQTLIDGYQLGQIRDGLGDVR